MELPQFIIIDDDPVSNVVCKMTIEKGLKTVTIKTFTNPQEGLLFIKSNYKPDELKATILFLDINMPVMTGWEFLEHFEDLNDTIKKNIHIYILSSSVDPKDKERSNLNQYVKGHVIKPLTIEIIKNIVNA